MLLWLFVYGCNVQARLNVNMTRTSANKHTHLSHLHVLTRCQHCHNLLNLLSHRIGDFKVCVPLFPSKGHSFTVRGIGAAPAKCKERTLKILQTIGDTQACTRFVPAPQSCVNAGTGHTRQAPPRKAPHTRRITPPPHPTCCALTLILNSL